MFDSKIDTLVQFRLPANWTLPPCVRDVGTESEEEHDARVRRNQEKGGLVQLIERNGASLLNIRERITSVGLKLVDASAQLRTLPPNEHRQYGKRYLHLTFAFRSAGEENVEAYDFFDNMTRHRWEYVSVATNPSPEHAIFTIMAKTLAQKAIQLRTIDNDPDASAFGIVVSKAVPRSQRPENNGHTIDWIAQSAKPAPKAAFVPKLACAMPTLQAPIEPRPVEKPSSGDHQLDRLIKDGWNVKEQGAATVTLFKGEGGAQRTMTHHRPKNRSQKKKKR